MFPGLGTLFLAILSSAQEPAQALKIWDQSQGCFHSERKVHEFTRVDKDFVEGDWHIPVEKIDRIRALAVSGNRDPKKVFGQLSGFSASLEDAKAQILKESFPSGWESLQEKLAPLHPRIAELLKPEHLLPFFETTFLGTDLDSSTTVEFGMQIPSTPPMRITSFRFPRPGLMPWTVKQGDETWQVYSIELLDALRDVADPAGPNFRELKFDPAESLKPDQNLQSADSELWFVFGKLRRELEALFSNFFLENLPGYEVGRKVLTVKDAHMRSPYFQGDGDPTLEVDLVRNAPEVVNYITWRIRIRDRQADTSWEKMLSQLEQVSDSISHVGWIPEWEAKGKGKEIQIVIGEERCGFESDDWELVKLAWTQAFSSGSPSIRACLMRENRYGPGMNCGATVVLDNRGEHSLVLEATPGEGGHWLDWVNPSFSLFGLKRETAFATVSSDGKLLRSKLGESK